MSELQKITYQDYLAHGVVDNPFCADDQMLETHGEELEHVKSIHAQDPLRVWTLLDCEGKMIIVAGFHYVNREGYYITERPAASEFTEVDLDT